MSRDELIGKLAAAHKEIEPDQEVEVGLFRPEDAQGISLAYYETYGDSFPIEHVYDPEEVVRLNGTEEQYNIVARTPRGEVVGLAGLFRHAPNPDVYEAGQLMVLKSYRQGNVARDIAREILENQPPILGIPVVFGEAVCNHPISQQLALESGMKVTGLEVECMPSEAYAKEGGFARNVSLLLTFKVLQKTLCDVYLPQEYADILESLYDEFEYVRDGLSGQPLAGKTEKSEFILPKNRFARITVVKAGEDFQQVVEAAETKVGDNGLVQMYLNLGDPAAPEATTCLREKGYFFGGLLPRWFESDGLVMQKVPRDPDWDAMRLHGEKAKAMHAFVRADYEVVTKL